MAEQPPSMTDLRDRLLGEIRSAGLGRGEALPSLRDIASRFGVTKASAEKAVRTLVQDGICYTEPGRGAFLAADSSELADTAVLGFVFGVFEYPRTGVLFYRQVYEGAHGWICDGRYNVMKFYEWRSKTAVQKAREWKGIADRLSGAVALGIYDDADCMLLRNSGLPVVVLDYDTRDLGVDCAVLDCAGSMLRLGRAVLARGASEIFFARPGYGPKSQDPASEQRRRGLKRAAAEAGLPFSDREIVDVAGAQEATELGRLAECLAKLRGGGRRGAVVCEDSGLVKSVVGALTEAGLSPGTDYVLAYSSPERPPREIAGYPAVLAAFDFRRLGAAGMEMLGERMEKGPGRPRRICLREEIVDWSPGDAAGAGFWGEDG